MLCYSPFQNDSNFFHHLQEKRSVAKTAGLAGHPTPGNLSFSLLLTLVGL